MTAKVYFVEQSYSGCMANGETDRREAVAIVFAENEEQVKSAIPSWRFEERKTNDGTWHPATITQAEGDEALDIVLRLGGQTVAAKLPVVFSLD